MLKVAALATASALALVWLAATEFRPAPLRAQPSAAPPAPPRNPERNAYWGDLHLHTELSSDAFVLMGTRVGPEDAYRFASGETIAYLGAPIRRRWPLDFLAVTDHSEKLGVVQRTVEGGGALGDASTVAALQRGSVKSAPAQKALFEALDRPANRPYRDQAMADAWEREKAAANRYYRPGRFTTFLAYEYTAMKDGANLHRNVIFRGDAPAPFTSDDSADPADLWRYLQKIRAEGFEALAISHNANASNGLMFDWTTLDGRPIDRAAAALRIANEPLTEIAQNKGQSETVPELSANDEFANYEVFEQLLISPTKSNPGGSYVRDALSRGMLIQQRVGVNPYKLGFVGDSDFHSGLSTSSQADYAGEIGRANLGGGKPDDFRARAALGQTDNPDAFHGFAQVITTAGGITGVWAESNTREDIYAALRRRETFATSGDRIRVRFFGGWSLPSDLFSRPDWVKQAYALGVPMGSDLPLANRQAAPRFAIEAVKDPDAANLDRVQVIKVWVDHGHRHEQVFDVAWAGGRRLDPKTGKLQPIGDTVDLKTGQVSNTIGTAQLQTIWTDPSFKPGEQAAYYVRVLEIPTARWSTLLAIEHKLPFARGVPLTEQQRAWSSPIWYAPPGSRS
ncbi:MAG: DUF3604 domain-containing protein [Caulobacteraceae bacterium]|nr:DUF3604 domain-containing protein [Caulobacteraceae bacterium]